MRNCCANFECVLPPRASIMCFKMTFLLVYLRKLYFTDMLFFFLHKILLSLFILFVFSSRLLFRSSYFYWIISLQMTLNYLFSCWMDFPASMHRQHHFYFLYLFVIFVFISVKQTRCKIRIQLPLCHFMQIFLFSFYFILFYGTR